MKKNVKIKLSIYFAILTTATIVATTFLFTIFLSLNMNNLFGKYQESADKLSNSLVLTISQCFVNDINSNNGYKNASKIIYTLLRDKRVNYVYLKDNKSILKGRNIREFYVDGEHDEFRITDDKDEKFIKDTSVKKRNNKTFSYNISVEKNSSDNISKDKNLNRYVLYLGLPLELTQLNIHESFSEMVYKILIVFIIIGAIASYMMGNVVTKPLLEFSKAAKEISDGNFNIEIQESKFDEINELVYSYNEMAIQLSELYSSLELKVQERTNALEEANFKLKETQAMMVHSEKMRSLGELVAGIAHEINNPVNFIHGNIMILQNYADDLFNLIDLYAQCDESIPEDIKKEIEQLKTDIDLDFLRDDIKELIRSCIEGTQRTKNIVLDLKNFSRMEEMVLTEFEIPKEIDTTLNILNNKYKNRITVIKNFDPNVPKIEAYGGQLNQVFMNILDNAQEAIPEQGTVTINTKLVDNGKSVQIEFIDTGTGIEPKNIKKVFDPFFTTKAVGKGTGLGMSISYRVIHDHNGTITVDSTVGKGTKFTIVLPINHLEAPATKKFSKD